MDEVAWQQWFDAIWAAREERIYPEFFGDTGPGIYPIPVRTFESLGRSEPDERYLTHGVFECPPQGLRDHWLYVTSGMSNPWGDSPETVDPRNFSGLGFEFTLHTRERARWPIQLLHWVMAVQLLVAAGEVQGSLLEINDRIPLGAPLYKSDGVITQLLVARPPEPPAGYPPFFQVASGKVELMLLIGMTQRESEFASSQGAEPLRQLLQHHEIFPLTDPGRISFV